MKRNKPLLIALIIFVSASSYISAQQSDARAVFHDAEDARGSGSIYLAIERYKEAIALNPQYVDALEGLAESYFSIGEYGEALEHVRYARTINKTSVALATLEGRIMLGLGDFMNAEERFASVLSKEPNNMNAIFGLAELDVAEGRPASAAQRFAAGLRAQPGNVRALLSLVTLNDAAGNTQAAERYVREALVSASGDPLVRYIAAKHYFARGDLDEAMHHVALAIEIRPDFIDAVRLSGAISLRSGSYTDAVDQLELLLTRDNGDYLLWYSLGVAYERTGQYEKGLNAFARALNIRSDDEISRLALEQLLITQYPVDSEIRERFAMYRFAAAKAFLVENLSEAALEHYRRGLLLNPRSKDGRFGYASIYKSRGNYAKYVSELNVLVELELSDLEVADEVEIYESILSEAVHNDWDQEQFLIERARHSVKIFSVTRPSAVMHPEADATLVDSLASLLHRFENIAVLDGGDNGKITGFSQAFEMARVSGSHYFILVDFDEKEREITMTADIYHGETGAKLFSYITQNTGNGRVEVSLRKIQ